MVAKQAEASTNDNLPAPVQAARAVLATQGAVVADEEARKQWNKVLPNLALGLARAGQEVTEDILTAHMAQGLDHCQGQLVALKQNFNATAENKKPQRDYDSVRALLVQTVAATHPDVENQSIADRVNAAFARVDGNAGFEFVLCHAARYGHLDIVQYVVENGVDIHTHNDQAVFSAAENGHLDIFKYLHENGADIRANKDKALHSAVEKGHLHIVRYLFEQDQNWSSAFDYCVFLAIKFGHIELLKCFQEQRTGIDKNLASALSWAVELDQFEMLDYLCANGVSLERINLERREKVQKAFAIMAQWKEIHNRFPAGLYEVSPYYFRANAFDAVVMMLKKEGYTEKDAHIYAYHAAGLFGTESRVLDYLERWGMGDRLLDPLDLCDIGENKQPLHDIIQNIRLPQEGRFDVKAWGDAVLRHGPKMTRLVKFADRLPQPEKDSRGGWSYTKTREVVAQFAYENAGADPDLAALCFEYDWDEDDFESAREAIAAYKKKYGDKLKPGNRIPAVTIDGAMFGKDGYKFYKLPDGDVRGLLLGEFTDCCQHMAGQGSECAEHGFLSEDSGFYVVADAANDNKIVAQSWAWRGTKGELVLDSLESLSGHFNVVGWKKLLDEFVAQVVANPDAADITAINVGTCGATPELSQLRVTEPAMPKGYNAYRDSHQQYRLWQKKGLR